VVGGDPAHPFSVIAPVIIVICAIGAYTVHSSLFDVF
jgi:putative tricarboxylic transport membrane protein